MKLALHSLMWAWEPFASVVEHVRELGIYNLDLGALPGGCGHLEPLSSDLPARCEKLMAQLSPSCRFVALTADHPDLSSADITARRLAVDYTLRAMQAARLLGASLVGTSLGSIGKGRQWSEAINCAVESLCQIIQQAPAGVRLAVELHVTDVCNSVPKARYLMEAVGDPRLGLVFDTSLLFYNHIDIDEAFAELGKYLLHVHLRGATQETYFAIPGRDEVNFRRFFKYLNRIQYEGAMSLELYEVEQRYGMNITEALQEAVPYLQDCGAPGGREDTPTHTDIDHMRKWDREESVPP